VGACVSGRRRSYAVGSGTGATRNQRQRWPADPSQSCAGSGGYSGSRCRSWIGRASSDDVKPAATAPGHSATNNSSPRGDGNAVRDCVTVTVADVNGFTVADSDGFTGVDSDGFTGVATGNVRSCGVAFAESSTHGDPDALTVTTGPHRNTKPASPTP
jgi:hypothetical protein